MLLISTPKKQLTKHNVKLRVWKNFPFHFRLHANVGSRLRRITLIFTRYFWKTSFFSILILSFRLNSLIVPFHHLLLPSAELWMFSEAGPVPVLWTGACFQSVQRAWGLLWCAHWALSTLQVQCDVEGTSYASNIMWKSHTNPRQEQQLYKSKSNGTAVSRGMVWSPLHPKPP